MQRNSAPSSRLLGSFPDDLTGLTQLLDKARDRSRSTGNSVFARLSLPFPAYETITSLELPRERDYFAWERADASQSFVGISPAVTLTGGGESRFQQLKEQVAALAASACMTGEPPAGEIPLCFAGGAFDIARKSDPAWQGFDDAVAIAPALLFSRTQTGSFVSLSTVVGANTDIEQRYDELRRELDSALALFDCDNRQASEHPAVKIATESQAGQRWQDAVNGLKQRIASSEVQKVVLARRVTVEASQGFSVTGALERMQQRFAACSLFAVRRGNRCFLGAAPEMLVSLSGRTVLVDSVAGSAPRGRDDAEDQSIGLGLLADAKERWEHELVSRGVVASIRDVCSEINLPETPVLRRMANVQHLHTPIEATASQGAHVLDLVAALHPTPATAGLPTEPALRLIRETEDFSRGWYAGPVGWIGSDGSGAFAVALRSALVQDTQALLYAGCGIVEASDADREYRESDLKLEAMLWALNAK